MTPRIPPPDPSWIVPSTVAVSAIGGATYLIALDQLKDRDTPTVLAGTAQFIWISLSGGHSERSTAQRAAEHFDVPVAETMPIVSEFAHRLAAMGFLVPLETN